MGKFRLHTAPAFLATLMLVKMLGMPLVFITFQIDKDYIAAKLCENRYKPQLHCDGQCILMKKLAKANESNESKESKGEHKTISVDFCESLEPITTMQQTTPRGEYSNFIQQVYKAAHLPGVFHPPAVNA